MSQNLIVNKKAFGHWIGLKCSEAIKKEYIHHLKLAGKSSSAYLTILDLTKIYNQPITLI